MKSFQGFINMGFKQDFLKWYYRYLSSNEYGGLVLAVNGNQDFQPFIDSHLIYYQEQENIFCRYLHEVGKEEFQKDNIWPVPYGSGEKDFSSAMSLVLRTEPDIIIIDCIINTVELLEMALSISQMGYLVIACVEQPSTKEFLQWVYSFDQRIQTVFMESSVSMIEYYDLTRVNKEKPIEKAVKISTFNQFLEQLLFTTKKARRKKK